MNMNKKLYTFIFIFVICNLNVIAEQVSSSSMTGGIDDDISGLPNSPTEETPIVEVEAIPGQVLDSEPAPQWVIDKVNDYVISKVGENYFSQHFKLQKSYSNTNLDKTGAKYKLTYLYTHNLKDNPDDTPYQVEHFFELRADPDGELVEYRGAKYRGPRQPYQFLISENEANQIAIGYGLKEPFEVRLSYGRSGYNSDTSIEEGTYAWVAWSKNYIPERNIEGLFIDVDTGSVIGKKTSKESYVEEAQDTEEAGAFPNKEEKVMKFTEKLSKQEKNKLHKSFTKRIFEWVLSWFR